MTTPDHLPGGSAARSARPSLQRQAPGCAWTIRLCRWLQSVLDQPCDSRAYPLFWAALMCGICVTLASYNRHLGVGP